MSPNRAASSPAGSIGDRNPTKKKFANITPEQRAKIDQMKKEGTFSASHENVQKRLEANKDFMQSGEELASEGELLSQIAGGASGVSGALATGATLIPKLTGMGGDDKTDETLQSKTPEILAKTSAKEVKTEAGSAIMASESKGQEAFAILIGQEVSKGVAEALTSSEFEQMLTRNIAKLAGSMSDGMGLR